MSESKDNFVAHGLSGIGTFHIRGRKTFLRKIRAKPSEPDSKERIAEKNVLQNIFGMQKQNKTSGYQSGLCLCHNASPLFIK